MSSAASFARSLSFCVARRSAGNSLQPALRVEADASPVQNGSVTGPEAQSIVNRPYLAEDRLSQSAMWFVLGLGVLMAIAAGDGESNRVGRRLGLLLLSLAGVCLAAVVKDLFLAVVAIELAALPATLVLFVEPDVPNARAAAARSLALNLLALALLLAAAFLVRATFGTANFEELRAALPQAGSTRTMRSVAVASSTAGEICCVLLLSGLGVFFLAAPFQLAAGEIFDGAKFWGVGLTALFPRGAALLLMIRVLVDGPPRLHGTAQTLLTAVGFLTILVGALLAVWQIRIRRLLAFFVVFQSGFILLSLAGACCETARPIATPWLTLDVLGGVGAACFCFAIDAIALVGLLVLVASRRQADQPCDELPQVAAAIRQDKFAAFAFCVLLLSLAGVPPFAGFWPRSRHSAHDRFDQLPGRTRLLAASERELRAGRDGGGGGIDFVDGRLARLRHADSARRFADSSYRSPGRKSHDRTQAPTESGGNRTFCGVIGRRLGVVSRSGNARGCTRARQTSKSLLRRRPTGAVCRLLANRVPGAAVRSTMTICNGRFASNPMHPTQSLEW